MAEESAVKVCIRVRPLIEREEATAKEGTKPVLYWKTDEKSVQNCVDDGNATKCFNFDRVFGANESTAQLYHDIAMPLVASAVQGYNGTIFAYGQTSSGKTFTMMGSDCTPGVIPLAMEDVFQTIKIKYPKKEFLLRVSYMEIYNETVADLLVDNWKRKPLEVREDSRKTVYVADLTEELVTNPAQALAWIRKGEKNRQTAKTKMNQRSSRSHTIFRMILESREDGDGENAENADGAITVSHLNLVDLAGSERASQTGAEGARFIEGCNINKSLFTLGQVIKKLSEENQRGFTNYRDSKLTRILQNSLGGNAKTVIICTITPATLDETLGTLQFASTAKYMKNDPHVTEISDDGALLKRYRNEIVDLKRRLQEVSSVTQTTATEKESLFLLLQEKEQLRIEQTDKIHNLTRLLVTSTSFVATNKMPKRRVTWGGKLLKPPVSSDGHVKPSELSFAEPVTRKMSTHSEQGDYDEEFESRWEGPYESSYCPEMNQNSFSSFGDSPQISDKVSELENRLKAETNQKEEAESLLKAETGQKEEAESLLKAETDQKEQAESRLKAETDQKEQAESRLKAETNQKEEAESRLKAETDQKEQAESRLKVETDQKAEALAKAETLHRRVEELDAQLAIEALQTHGAMEKMAAAENAAVELNLQLKVETQQKLESVVMLELRVADLERQLQEWTDSTSKADEIQQRSDVTMQLLNQLVANQEDVLADSNKMKLEVDFVKEQAERLEKEKEELSQELAEKRDQEEFNSLEKDEHEQELKREISSLKKDLESAEYKCQEFEAQLSLMSEDLKKQSDWVEALQSLKDKDLVQEVSKLRRSLDDAEGLSRETKKEWAILRSQNISLKERDVEQTVSYEKMEAGVSGLHHQVETEKSRYKKMQADLQRELNMAFDENTKLTTLLNGKVPKNLIDSMTLEREVTNLKKELTVCHDKEVELQAQLKELSPLQHLPEKVDNLLKQMCDLTEALCAVESQRDSLLSVQAQSQEESHQLRDALQTLQGELAVAEHKEAHLTQRCADTTEDLDTVRSDLARLDAERTQLLATVQDTRDRVSQLTEELQNARAERDCLLSEKVSATQSSTEQVDSLLSKVSSLTEESDQLKVDLQESVDMNREELRTTLEENCLQKENLKRLEETLEECHSQIQVLEQELDGVKEERNELKDDLRENVDTLIENQADLFAALEKITQLENGSCVENVSLEELQNQNRQLSEELASLKAERDGLLSSASCTMSTVTCLTDEMDQLKEILEGLRQEKNQLRADLEANMETVVETSGDLRTAQEKIKQLESGSCAENVSCLEELQNQNRQLSEELDRVRAERDGLFSNASATEEVEKLLSTVTCLTEEVDQLKEILEALRQEKNQLRAELEANMEMTIEKQLDADEKITLLKEEVDLLRTLSEQENESCPENVSHLEELKNQNQQLSEELDGVRVERDSLLSSASAMSTVTSLTEERDQLKEMHEGLRQEKIQLGADLEANMETSQAELRAAHDTIEHLNKEVYLNTHAESHAENVSHLDKLKNEKTEKQEELNAAQEKIGHLKEEVGHLKTQIEQLENERRVENFSHLDELQNQNQQLTKELAGLRAERDGLLSSASATMSTLTTLTEERDQLKEMHEGLRREKIQLGADLEANMETSQAELRAAHDTIEHLNEEVYLLNTHAESHAENVSHLEKLKNEKTEKQEELNAAQEKIGHLKEEVGHLKTQIEQLENERRVENFSHLDELQNQNQQLSKELAGLRAERDGLLSSASATMSTVTSLTEERDQLKEKHEELRQEKIQLGADLEANMETNQQLSKELAGLRVERDGLLSSASAMSTVTSLTEERDQLKVMHEGLRQEKIQLGADLEANMETTRQLSEELDRVKTERDCLVSNTKISTEELEKLTSRVTCLTDERDQLQKELDAAQERTRLLKQEVDVLNSGCKQLEQLQNKIKVLEQELECVNEERNQLKTDLQENVDKTIQNQLELRNADEKSRVLVEEVDLLRTQSEEIQNQIEQLGEELDIVKIDKLMAQSDLSDANERLTLLTANAARSSLQMSSRLQDSVEQLQTRQLSEELDRVKTERDCLVSNTKISTEELEKLTSRVTCLTDERDQLQKELDAAQERTRLLKQEVDVLNSGCKQLEQLQNKIKVLEQELECVNEERNQLKTDLQENVDKTIQNQLELRNADEKSRVLVEEVDLLRTQSEEIQNQIEQLGEELDIVKIDKLMAQSDLSDANERLTLLTANAARSSLQMSSRLQDSVEQLQNYLHEFQVFMDNLCSSTTTQSQQEAYQVQISLVINFVSLHYPTKEAFVVLSRNVDRILLKKRVLLKSYAQDFMHVFKDLFQKDLDLFEEKRLQDVLMCKAEATLLSVADEDFQELWQQRLTELLDKRHLYLQQIPNVLEKLNLWRELTDKELSDELGETESFTEQLRALSNNQHLDSTSLDSIMSSRVTCRSAGLDNKKRTLEALRGDIRPLFTKVKILRGDAAIQLKQEMSNTATLLQTRGEITPLKTEVGLLKENQQLILQLKQSETQIEALLGKMTQLEQAQVNATSTHKRVTQLLQTQLQDVYAEVQTLKHKLQSVKTTEEQQPLAMETKRMKAELVKMQLELTSQSTDYEGRLQSLNKALDEKAIELRQLKMRTAQQDQECSFLQGKELCGKLSKAKGTTVESSTHLEEVKRLQVTITELESQVSSQQKETTKWKGRAVMLKEKTKVSGADKPMPRSPCTPTKRQLPVTFGSSHLNSPKKTLRKIPDSPRATAPGAAKSSTYFDRAEFKESEPSSKNQPFQFFDNSGLGSTAAMAEDSISLHPQNLDGGAEKEDEWWPKSPNKEEMCKAQ